MDRKREGNSLGPKRVAPHGQVHRNEIRPDQQLISNPFSAGHAKKRRAAEAFGLESELEMKAAIKRIHLDEEFNTGEGCFITELSNTPDDPQVSIARARVEPLAAGR